jgi:hypothetical protein
MIVTFLDVKILWFQSGDVAQVVEHLPSKHTALGSTPNTGKQNKTTTTIKTMGI